MLEAALAFSLRFHDFMQDTKFPEVLKRGFFGYSAAPVHPAGQDEEAGDRSASGQLGAAEVHGQWKP